MFVLQRKMVNLCAKRAKFYHILRIIYIYIHFQLASTCFHLCQNRQSGVSTSKIWFASSFLGHLNHHAQDLFSRSLTFHFLMCFKFKIKFESKNIDRNASIPVRSIINSSTQGRRKMKKVRGALRALKAQVLLGVRGHASRNFFSILSMLKHAFLHF